MEGIACEFGVMPQPAFSPDPRVRRLDQLATPKSRVRLMSHPITCLDNYTLSFRFILSFCLASCLAVEVREISAQEITTDSRSFVEDGFTSLSSDVPFEGWEHAGNWVIEDGAFYRAKAGGPLTYTHSTVPHDFELRFEWKVSKGCNSGIYYRPGQVEYQVLDNVHSPYGENPRQAAGSLFFCMAPSKDATRPLGEWNTGRIVCQGTVIQHWVNEEKVIDFDYTDPKWAEEVNLLGIRGGDLTGRGGRLWLQDHGQDVWYRKLRWREINDGVKLRAAADFQPMPIPPVALAKEQERVRLMLEKQSPETKSSRR